MYFNYLVDVPEVEGKIRKSVIKGTTYIYYEYDRVYKKETQLTYPQRTTIGKLNPRDPLKMWPNPTYYRYFESEKPPVRDASLNLGTYLVIRKIVNDYNLPVLLSHHFSERDTGLILDLAAYSIITEGNAAQYYPDYAREHPLFTHAMTCYSDSTVGSFFRSVKDDQMLGFLNDWNQMHDHREKVYLSYDSTNKNCQAGDIDMAEFGHAKTDIGAPVINYSVAYDTHNREPLFYELYSGSIPDTSEFDAMIGKVIGYGYKNIGFILDRGYFSKKNLQLMDDSSYSFVIMVKGLKSFVNGVILENKNTFESDFDHRIAEYGVYGMTVKAKLYDSDKKDRYFHLFFDPDRERAERRQLESEIDKIQSNMKKKQNQNADFSKRELELFDMTYDSETGVFLFGTPKSDVISRELQLAGYFCIITSDRMNARDAINLYKSRDSSEKLFCADKSFLGNNALGVQSEKVANTKTFVHFVALIIRCRIYTTLLDEVKRTGKRPNFMDVPAAIRQLEHIKVIWQPDQVYRLSQALTKQQKTILTAFGMTPDFVRAEAEKLGKQIQQTGGGENDGEIQ